MRSLNRMMVVGRLGHDPEARTSRAGNAWCTFSVATRRSKKDGDDWAEVTDWHDVRVFGPQAVQCQESLRKGQLVLVEGMLVYDKWTDDEGNKRSKARVQANNVQFLTEREVAQA